MSKDIYVVIEQRNGHIQNVGIELLGEATRLAAELGQQVGAILIGNNIKGKASLLHEYGADFVVIVEDPMLEEYTTEPYAKALAKVIEQRKPEIVLFGATSIGRDLAPRVAARIKTGLTADCTRLEIDEETKLLHMTRPAFGGNIMAVILCKTHRPQMATVRPSVMKALERESGRSGEVSEIKVDFTPADMTVEVVEVLEKERSATDITKAKFLICGGRGIGTPEFMGELNELAGSIGPDADVSASRAAVDEGWAESARQVGQTGKTVRPELYMACGVSGAVQHLVGMEESDFIVAININEDAPIFQTADLGIVGDAKQIVPKLTMAIRKHKEAKELRD